MVSTGRNRKRVTFLTTVIRGGNHGAVIRNGLHLLSPNAFKAVSNDGVRKMH